jgi:predicted methyltransferase
MSFLTVLSHYQVAPVLKAMALGKSSAAISPDLGLTTVEVILSPEFIQLPKGERLTWTDVKEIAEAKTSCFVVEDNSIKKIQVFSEETNLVYTLFPTRGAPTMLVSGVPMHRIKGTDPWADTLSKIKTIAPVVGQVLDTATGLGYTAMAAAESAEEVITIDLDPASSKLARSNPWSQGLFDNPKIRRILGDSFNRVCRFEDGTFARIIHDPPMFNLAGDLYSEEFHRELYRVLNRSGKLFHYIGDLESRSGRNVVKGVIRRLKQAGFTRVVPRLEAFGVVAHK